MGIDEGGNAETVNVTAISGDEVTIERGAAGTTARAHIAGVNVGVPGDLGGVGTGQLGGIPIQGSTYTIATVDPSPRDRRRGSLARDGSRARLRPQPPALPLDPGLQRLLRRHERLLAATPRSARTRRAATSRPAPAPTSAAPASTARSSASPRDPRAPASTRSTSTTRDGFRGRGTTRSTTPSRNRKRSGCTRSATPTPSARRARSSSRRGSRPRSRSRTNRRRRVPPTTPPTCSGTKFSCTNSTVLLGRIPRKGRLGPRLPEQRCVPPSLRRRLALLLGRRDPAGARRPAGRRR